MMTPIDFTPNLRDLIKLDGKGRILSVEYKGPTPLPPRWSWDPKPYFTNQGWWWNPLPWPYPQISFDPMTERHEELYKKVESYAPGHSSVEITELLGKPQAIETKVPVQEWPHAANKADVAWLYSVGPDGWGYHLALCFKNGICTDAIYLNYPQQSAYLKWKRDQITSYAPGKTATEILRRFGEPDDRAGPKKFETWTEGQVSEITYVGDETWTYDVLDCGGVWVGIKDQKCVTVNLFDSLH